MARVQFYLCEKFQSIFLSSSWQKKVYNRSHYHSFVTTSFLFIWYQRCYFKLIFHYLLSAVVQGMVPNPSTNQGLFKLLYQPKLALWRWTSGKVFARCGTIPELLQKLNRQVPLSALQFKNEHFHSWNQHWCRKYLFSFSPLKKAIQARNIWKIIKTFQWAEFKGKWALTI